MNSSGNSLTAEIRRALSTGTFLAIDNRDETTFQKLDLFIQEEVDAFYKESDEESFAAYSSIYSWYYEHALEKRRDSANYKDIYDMAAKRSINNLVGKIRYQGFLQENVTTAERKKINRFGKLAIDQISALIQATIKAKDFAHLSYILKRLHQCAEISHRHSEMQYEIRILSAMPLNDQRRDRLPELIEEHELQTYLATEIRRLFKATLFWNYYLFYLNKLSFDELSQMLDIFKPFESLYIQYQLMEDVYFLRENSFSVEASWFRWDHTDRMDGEFFSPPSVRTWITLGALLHLLKTDAFINYGNEEKDTAQVEAFDSILSTFEDMLRSFKEDIFDKWRVLFDVDSVDNFTKKIERLKQQVRFQRERNATIKETFIAELPVDFDIVENAKRQMRSGYENGNIVRELFSRFDNTTYLDQARPDDYVLGERNKVWLGVKAGFIANDQYYIPHVGLDTIGRNLQQQEENMFFFSVGKDPLPLQGSFFDQLDGAIQKVKDQQLQPTLIFIGSDLWWRYISNQTHADLKSSSGVVPENAFTDYGGSYKEIPIIKSDNQIMRDRVLVADFAAAFGLEQVVNNLHEKDPLTLNIEPIDQQEAMAIIASNPDYWKRKLSQQDAEIKLQNSLKLNFFTILKFIVKDDNAYHLMDITGDR